MSGISAQNLIVSNLNREIDAFHLEKNRFMAKIFTGVAKNDQVLKNLRTAKAFPIIPSKL